MNSNRFNRILWLLCSLLFFIRTSPGQQATSFKSFQIARDSALIAHKLIFVTFQNEDTKLMGRVRSANLSKFQSANGTMKGLPCLNFNPPWYLARNALLLFVPYDAEPYLRKKYASEDKTALVLDAFGNELYAEVCPGIDKLTQILKSLPEDASTYYSLLKNLSEHPDSLDLKLSLADLCQLYRATTASNKYYNEIAESRDFKKDTTLSDHVQSRLALNAYANGDYDKAEDLLSDHIKDFPHSQERPMQLFLLTSISVIKKHKDDATHYWQMLQTEFPNNEHTNLAKTLIDQYIK